MGIKYFYNFCLTAFDDTDLDSDILSAVRRAYFARFDKLRDKITYHSDSTSLLYDYCIEKNKPLRWTVKTADGDPVQEVLPADDGRYYLCFYREEKLVKRLLFSKLHTLLKAEYMDDSGVECRSLEPRRVQGGLCLLYTDNRLDEPVVLSEMPSINDAQVCGRVKAGFTDYSAAASTDAGVVWFLSDEQLISLRAFIASIEEAENLSFIGDEAPLFERINAADFNMKRNLSASLDISMAKDFGELPIEEDLPAENEATEQVLSDVVDDVPAVTPVTEVTEQEEEAATVKPDKVIMADGALYSYYGELDGSGNRSGYGRTVTDLGRTAYEGTYRSDKRSGKGAYFYKDGTLCYSGDWSENVRHGVGVGVSARDGSMHIGRWVNNKPEGNGVRLNADGSIKFVCKELSDGGTVLMHYKEDDTVVIAKYDQNGAKLSEKTISLAE